MGKIKLELPFGGVSRGHHEAAGEGARGAVVAPSNHGRIG